MTVKKERNIEYRIWNIEYRIRVFPNSKFQIPNSTQQGFTLLETMIAISVLLIGVVGPISIIGDSLHKIYFARDQVVAINLAQEAVEAVRQKRDTNMLMNQAWETGFDPNPDCGGGAGQKECVVDFPSASSGANIPSCIGNACSLDESLIYTNSVDNLYHQYLPPASKPVTATPTNFHRTVKVEKIVNNVEDKVTSTVTWNTGGTSGTVTVTENIFNWAH